MRPKEKHAKGAIEILEEAVYLLRRGSVGLLASYYIGSLPFALGLLYFWADMSRNGQAEKYNVTASLGLALLFVWMKCFQTIFTGQLQSLLYNKKITRWSFRGLIRVVVLQTTIQASSLFLLPVALVIAMPFGWVYAFYQSFTVVADGRTAGIREACKITWKQAQLWPGQNHILISVFSLFSLVVFLNLGVSLYVFPHLLKSLFGIDTIFVRSGVHVLNTTFLAVTVLLTYLCLDPLIKAVYVLRCFYGVSRQTGDDLKAELQDLFYPGKKLIAALLFLLVLIPSTAVIASESYPAVSPANKENSIAVDPSELQESIEHILQQQHYTWRLPRQKEVLPEDRGGMLHVITGWLVSSVKYIGKHLGSFLETVLEWVEKIFPKPEHGVRKRSEGRSAKTEFLLGALLLVLLAVILYWGLKIWQRFKREAQPAAAPAMKSLPDLESEEIRADDLKANHWLQHARELIEQKSYRLAMRALYFAILAHLAEQEIIIIAKYKSNHDYKTELNRKLHEHPELVRCFAENVKIIDRVWYGLYAVTAEEFEFFTANQERIMNFAWI